MSKTSTALTFPPRSRGLAARSSSLLELFLAGRSVRTREAYAADFVDFGRFLEVKTAEEALSRLLAGGQGKANETAHAYRAHLLERGLAAATVNRRLASLRSFAKMARLFGVSSFTLDVESVRAESYRDTRGPGRTGVRLLLDELESRKGEKAARDLALIRVIYGLGLRRGEAVSLDLEDVDLETGTVSILGKGRTERETLTLPEYAKAALEAWIAVRGAAAGPLFVNFDRARKGSRLRGRSVARIVGDLGDAVGLSRLRPHGLRHVAITDALDAMGGNERAVQRFSRHKDIRVLYRYDDNRQDLGGEVARLVDARV
jgi:integrase/recombinase XerC